MSVGALFINSGGSIQLDNQTPCMSCVKTGRWTSGSSFSLALQGTSPMMAIRALGCSAAITGTTYTNGTYTWSVDRYTESSGWTIDYYIFDKPPRTPSAHGCGIEIYDDAGYVTYTSAYAPMRIAGTGVKTYPAGRTYALHQHRCKIDFGRERYDTVEKADSYGNPNGEFEVVFAGYEQYPSGWHWEGTRLVSDRNPEWQGDWIQPPVVLVLDVTNI